jgi:pimeloyl-ACP methyl ester carboxylesterase
MSAFLMLVFLLDSQTTACHDSLVSPDPMTESDDAISCLSGFLWPPAAFTATIKPVADSGFDRGISFPSPCMGPGGPMFVEWRMARQNHVLCEDRRPAVIVVHESGRGMHAGRAIAQALSRTGIHTFMVHLPGYGQRAARRPDQGKELVEGIRQGAMDTRRAADVIKSLNGVDQKHVSILGVSLGGFVASLAGSLDSAFDQHFILMAGADLPGMFRKGEREVADLRKKMETHRTGAELTKWLHQVEPARVAHRLPAERTTLYVAMFDIVVPPSCSEKLATTIGLPPEQIVRMPCGHHSAVAFLLPMVLDVSRRVHAACTL